ncbi:hypothetical protein CHN51_09030 [Sphingorhabdus sp. YGSMI21]|nr:hypothetical protein CHN51_09030 [Sphingorhabdus sp. YGSMI21]
MLILAVDWFEWMLTHDPALLSFLKNRLGNLALRIPPVYQRTDFPATLPILLRISLTLRIRHRLMNTGERRKKMART